MILPQADALKEALSDAGEAHHDFEQVVLGGKRDELWAGFYAAFVLGRLGSFTAASTLSRLLEESSSSGNWAEHTAAHVLTSLKAEQA